MELKTTRWAIDGAIAKITLSRPERHNTWTGRMHTEMRHLLQTAESDPSIRVAIITGDPAGEAFCPGADSQALDGHVARGSYDAGTPSDIARPGFGVRAQFDADFANLLGLETVTIAAINGAVAGVGLALACWCDLRVVAEGAKLTAAHGRLNLPAEYGLAWILPRLVGQARANELLLTSRIFVAEEAQAMGLTNRLVAPADVMSAAQDLAHELVAVSPHSLRATKRQLADAAVDANPAAAVADAQQRLDQMTTEADYREAVAAYSEKRAPRWSDT